MEKTITFKIETPRFWKNYKARKKAKKQIARMQFEEIEQIFSGKNQKVESEKVPESTTEKIQQQTQTSLDDVRKLFGNKIIFKENKSGNFNAEKGVIDEVIEKIEKMNPLPKCVKVETMPYGERKGKKTLFVNVNAKYHGTPLNKKHTKSLLEKLGYEAVSLD